MIYHYSMVIQCFGVAIPTETIKIFLDFFLKHPDEARGLEFQATPNGFCTLNR